MSTLLLNDGPRLRFKSFPDEDWTWCGILTLAYGNKSPARSFQH
jgi:hypothetical protein